MKLRWDDHLLRWMPTLMAACLLVLTYAERGVTLVMQREVHASHLKMSLREDSIQVALNAVEKAIKDLHATPLAALEAKPVPMPERRKWTKPRWGSK